MKKITLLISCLLLTVFSYAQGHFVPAFTGSGTDHMTINVLTATIAAADLDIGDEIAIFDGNVCCGVVKLTKKFNFDTDGSYQDVAASKNDPPQGGYTAGHAISFKFWDASKCKEITPITPVFLDPLTGLPTVAPTFAAGESAFVKLTGAAPLNNPPTTNAGLDQTVNEGSLVTLDGSGSTDPDGDPLTYSWTVVPAGIVLSSTTAAKPTFTAPEVNADTDYTLRLMVSDCAGPAVAWDEVKITVKQVNKIPVANAGIDQTVNEGVLVTLNGTGSTDGDGDVLTYAWTAPAGITLSSATAASPTFTAPEVAADTDYTLSLVVNDTKANSTNLAQVKITVKQVNKIPVANAGPDQTPNENTLVTLDGSGSTDPDALDVLTYLWTAPAGITLSDATAQKPTFTAPEVNADTDYTLSLVVNDTKANSTNLSQVKITVKQVNKPPVANAGIDQSVNEGAVVTLDGTASTDPDALDVLTYLWTAPAGITLSSNTASKPTFTAPEVAIDTDYTLSLVVNDVKTNSLTADEVKITVKQVNKAPVANAGAAKTVTEKKTVELDGSLSSDPDNNVVLTYLWTAPGGITLSSATAQKPTFTAPAVAISTDYTFSLVVNDGALNSPSVNVVITVIPNRAPVANAGPAQSQSQNSLVTLDGSGSTDPDGDVVTYLWTAPGGIALSSTTAQKPTFTAPPVAVSTDYTFSLVVNDGVLNSPSVNVVITVIPNKKPVANAGIAQTVNEGDPVTLDGSLSADGDSDPITYLWTAPAGITLSSTTAQKPIFTAPLVDANTDYTISLVVNDTKDNSVAASVVITVKQINKPPVVNAGPDQSINENTLVTLDGSGSSDPDALDVLTYLWTAPAGITLSSTSAAKPTFTAPEIAANTDYTFTLVVNDGTVSSAADAIKITVLQVNKVPVASVGPDQTVNENTLVTLDGSGSSDGDGDVMTYLWTAPAGITLSSATVAKPTFTAPEIAADTDYSLTLVVNDGKANSNTATVKITVKQVNKVPVANAGPDQTVNENTLVTLNGSGSTDGDGDVLTYLWTAPAGITLSSTTVANPTFTAVEIAVDTDYTLTLVVNDGKANSVSDDVKITVKQVNKIPAANAGPDQTINEGVVVTLDGTASTDGDGDALTYLWTAPAGITLSSTTASKPTFTAPEVAADKDYTLTLVVNDGKANSTSDAVKITVKQINKVPVANAGPDQSVYEVVLVTLDGSGSTDGDGEALTYSWTAPAGITLSSTTVAKPTFTSPIVLANTDYTFSLVVNDGTVDSAIDQIRVTVKVGNKTPIANAGPDQSINEGTVVTLDGTASSDTDNDPLTYKWTAPAGITLSSATAAKPTFTAPEVAANKNYTFTLVVNDGTVSSTADQVVVTVNQVNKAPIANAGIDNSIYANSVYILNGSTSSDPDPLDVLTYLWTAPAGITLSSNTVARPSFTAPKVANNTVYTFSLVVNDGIANSVADVANITVIPENKAPIANAGYAQSVNEGVIVKLDGTGSSDPDGLTLTYLWKAPSGVKLSSLTAAKPTFTAPEVAVNTKFTFSLVVNNGAFDSAPDDVVINVGQINKAPEASAGTDQTVNGGTVVTLDGSGSTDTDSDELTYLWTVPAGITLNSNTAEKPSFTAPQVLTETSYSFTLVVNDGKLSSATDQVVVKVKPNMPPAPTANAATDLLIAAFKANWNSAATATGYRLDVATNIDFTTFVSGYNDKDVGNVLTLGISGLNSNTSYYYRVRAYNLVGNSTYSSSIKATTLPNPPAAPTANPATNILQTSLSLNWSSSANTTGYRLDVATDNAFTSFVSGYSDKDVGNITTSNITGLNTSTTYYYRVRAYNADGTSTSSGTISATTLPNTPAPPTVNAATNVLQSSFNISWSASLSATGYRLDVATNSGFTSLVTGFSDKDVSNVTSFSITGLNDKTQYFYRVRAYSTGGTSANSNVLNATTISKAPAAPVSLTASSCNNLITLKWRKNSDPYFIRYRIYGGTTSNPTTKIDSTSSAISDTSKVISGLKNGLTYYFRVTAVNSDGPESPYSAQSTVTVKTGVVPQITSKWNNLLICYNVGDSISSYQWYSGSSAISGANSQSYITNKQQGTYKIETVDKNGCKNSSSTILITATKSLTVYPNPASSSFTLKLNDVTDGMAVIKVINSSGIKVLELQAENINEELLKEIAVNNLENGTYVVQVSLNQNELYSTKVIVKK